MSCLSGWMGPPDLCLGRMIGQRCRRYGPFTAPVERPGSCMPGTRPPPHPNSCRLPPASPGTTSPPASGTAQWAAETALASMSRECLCEDFREGCGRAGEARLGAVAGSKHAPPRSSSTPVPSPRPPPPRCRSWDEQSASAVLVMLTAARKWAGRATANLAEYQVCTEAAKLHWDCMLRPAARCAAQAASHAHADRQNVCSYLHSRSRFCSGLV